MPPLNQQLGNRDAGDQSDPSARQLKKSGKAKERPHRLNGQEEKHDSDPQSHATPRVRSFFLGSRPKSHQTASLRKRRCVTSMMVMRMAMEKSTKKVTKTGSLMSELM